MWLSLLCLIALSVYYPVNGVILGGPDAIYACGTYGFSFQDGTAPYTFHPMVGASASGTAAVGDTSSLVEQGYFATNDTTYFLYIGNGPGSVMEFYVTDATGQTSNYLWYTIRDGGSCLSSTANATGTATSQPLAGTAGTTTRYQSSDFPDATTRVGSSVTYTVPVTTNTGGVVVTLTPTATGFPSIQSASDASASVSFKLSVSTILTITGTVVAVLLLAIGFCCWRWRKARKMRQVGGRDQGQDLMMDADKNDSGLLLTAHSPLYRNVPSTPTSADRATPIAPLNPQVLPSSKELRMRGAVYREQDLEDGMSMSDVSGPMSTTASTSIWPASTTASHERPLPATPSDPSNSHNQQSLQALIGRELENMLQTQTPRTLGSPTSFADTPSPLSSLNDLQSSIVSEQEQIPNPFSEKPPLSLTIPRDARSILPSSTTPISRRDMEVLADLVAQRLIRDRGAQSPTRDSNAGLPPPSYS